MKANFSELLDAQRIRSLWGRSVDPSNAVDTLNQLLSRLTGPDPGPDSGTPATAAEHVPGSDAAGVPSPEATAPAAGTQAELPDLADVPIEPPHQIFNALEAALRQELGSRSSMVRNMIEPLRVRIHALDPTATPPPFHPLRHAAGGSIFNLLGRLEDTLRGLRRVAGR